MDARPTIHYLVCFLGPDGDFLTTPHVVTDEEALNQQRWGATLLPDPEDEVLADLWDAYQSDLKGGRHRGKMWFER